MAVALTLCPMAAASASAQPVACGQVITEDTTLESDLTCPRTSGLVIGAPGVTLDLGGHTLTVDGGRSIQDRGYDDVTIRNGSVHFDNDAGIELSGVSGGRIQDISISGFRRAVFIIDSDHIRFERVHIGDQRITISNTDYSVFRDNTMNGGLEAGVVIAGTHNRIVDNTIRISHEGVTLWLRGSDHTLVSRNLIDSGRGPNLSLSDADDNRIVNNTMISTNPTFPGWGVWLTNSNRNAIVRNDVTGTEAGVRVISGADNTIARNRATNGVSEDELHVEPDGFLVEAAATGTLLYRNLAVGWEDDGIDVDAPGTLLRRNTAIGNADLGIEAIPRIIDLGRNRASGNGNPFQCLNVLCR
jgi:parallel beta-helix repeat protein